MQGSAAQRPAVHFLARLIAADEARTAALAQVAALGLPDAWIGAGFLRNALWNRLHGLADDLSAHDIDVVYFDPAEAALERDRTLEARLARAAPGLDWSVTNQARMAQRHGDVPYQSCAEALACWPETATAVAIRVNPAGKIEVLAPHGLGDLYAQVIRPTPHIAAHRPQDYLARLATKRWRARWPNVTILDIDGGPAPD